MTSECKHPAKFSQGVLEEISKLLPPEPLNIIDPFAGVGGVHQLRNTCDKWNTVGVEIEPEWAFQSPRTVVGDATALPFPTASFDALVTSVVYGNRMSDHHNAKDPSRRITYRHTLGRPLHPNNIGGLQWTQAGYKSLHERAWTEAQRVLKPGSDVIINVSNHIRKGRVQKVVEWHLWYWLNAGASLVEVIRVATPRMKFGANRNQRVDAEHILVLRRSEEPWVDPIPERWWEEPELPFEPFEPTDCF